MPSVTKVKSGSMYEDKNSYSRLVIVDHHIYVSNTAGIDYKTRYISDDVGEQAEKALQNIGAALTAVGSSLGDIVRIVAHVPDAAGKDAVAAVMGTVFKGIDPASTMLCTPLTRPDLKVEFEVTAVKGISEATQERIKISI